MKGKLMCAALVMLSMLLVSTMAVAAENKASQEQMTDQKQTDQGQMTDRGVMDQNREGIDQTAEGAVGDMAGPEMLEARQDAQEAVEMATNVIRNVVGSTDPEMSIPDSVIQQAQGIVIVPSVVKAGLIAGGRFGRGVLLSKNQEQWSLPVIVTVGGASLGAQIGVEESDLIMVFNDRQAVQNLIEDSDFTLGVDASVAAGTAGAKAKAVATEADVVTYRRAEGLFAGVALTGGVLDVDEDAMVAYYRMYEPSVRAYYGEDEAQMAQKVLNASEKDQQIFQNAPESAKTLQDAMSKLTAQK